MTDKQKKNLYCIIAAAVLLAAVCFIPSKGVLRLVLFLIPYLVIGRGTLVKAVKGILKGQPFDEYFLMAVATVGAFALGEYVEGVAVMLFYQIGELFESIAVGKSRRSISDLMDIRPDVAYVESDGEIKALDPDEVEPGTEILVRPGEKVPIDGVVVSGASTIDTAALTGESLPRSIKEGQEIISGSINLSSPLRIKTTKEFGESTVSKILELTENASSRKSNPENFISKFARIYTPAVCFMALALAIVPPVVRIILSQAPEWSTWIYRALTFLVISCPCALVISIPLTFFAGIGGASSAGVLIKGSNFMETLSKVKYVLFDKTGTVTKGVFEVTKVSPVGMSEQELLEYAALAESYSPHPIAVSLRSAYGRDVDEARVENTAELTGSGVTAEVDGKVVAVGNDRLMKSMGIETPSADHAGTVTHVCVDGRYAGYILISDVIKTTAADAISALKKMGVKKTVMLTGDRRQAAETTAAAIGVDLVEHELLPEDKVRLTETFLASKDPSETVAFVGDGINDAPVLSRADVGIAMGALGSDAAIEAADVVLMDDDPMKIPKAVSIAKKCLKIAYENIYFAIGVKLICLFLSAIGVANMWYAVFADVGVMVIAVLNAIRALKVKNL